MKILQKFKRWRRSLGFGIHSPFAFRFVNEVLCPSRQYSYYAYAEIAEYMHDNHYRSLSQRNARLIFRIINFLQPSTVTIASENSFELIRFIISKANPNCQIIAQGGEFLICDGYAQTPEGSKHAFFTDIENPSAKLMSDSLEQGHIYTDNRSIVLINHQHLPLQRFEIKF